jgi:hypothetical protein
VELAQEKARKEFAFEIITSGRGYIISANSEQDMKEWMAAIFRASGNTPVEQPAAKESPRVITGINIFDLCFMCSTVSKKTMQLLLLRLQFSMKSNHQKYPNWTHRPAVDRSNFRTPQICTNQFTTCLNHLHQVQENLHFRNWELKRCQVQNRGID